LFIPIAAMGKSTTVIYCMSFINYSWEKIHDFINAYFTQHFRRCGDNSRAATNQEWHLIKRILSITKKYTCLHRNCESGIKHDAHRLVQHTLQVIEMTWKNDSTLALFFLASIVL